MPCDMMSGADSGAMDARDALARVRVLEQQVAQLEQALCSICKAQVADKKDLNPELRGWYEYHANKPGHKP